MSKTIAFLLHNYFEQSEYAKVNSILKDKGYNTVLITTNDDKKVQAMQGDVDKSSTYNADLFLQEAKTEDYDAIILPGGTVNADKLRINEDAQNFVKSFYTANKPVAAICHAPWVLINAGLVDGKILTAYKSLQQDINNAGATFVDKQVQQDGVIITSRNPDDIEAFADAIDVALS